MSAKSGLSTAKPPPTTLVSHHEVAAWWGVTPKLIRRWIEKGEFPLPHSCHGTYLFFDRTAIEHRLKTGLWPTGTKFSGADRTIKQSEV